MTYLLSLIVILLSFTFPSQAQLNWGSECRGGDVDRHLNRVHQVIAERNMFNDIDEIATRAPDGEGRLRNDDIHRLTRENNRRFQSLLTVSMCARFGDESKTPKASECRNKAKAGVLNWIRNVPPTGNPINDSDLIPIMQSADLLKSQMLPSEREEINTWLRGIVSRGDSFTAELRSNNDVRLRMNWSTWRLTLRAMAGQIISSDDPQGSMIVEETRSLVNAHIGQNLAPPRNFNPMQSVYSRRNRTCRGEDTSGTVSEYGSFDFRQRDALRYHNYNMLAYTEMQWFVPRAVSSLSGIAINNGVSFIEPYVTGERVHQEFSCTTSPIDIRRRDAGDSNYSIRPWSPEDDRNARVMFRMSRMSNPEAHSFTNQFVTNQFAPYEKLMFALRECEVPTTPSIPRPVLRTGDEQ